MDRPQRELKFTFPNSRAAGLGNWLDVRCRPDPDFAAGRISSIYFDLPGGKLLGEKIDSDYLKTKVRLRWYGDWQTGAPAGNVFLEVKQRIGSSRKKFRQRLEWAAADLDRLELDDPRLLDVNRRLAAAGFRFGGPLRPAICLAYRRRRWLEAATGARVCLDHDIAPVRIHGAWGTVAGGPPLAEGVFEVKGTDERLPASLQPLVALGCRRESFSKYQRCMAQGLPPARTPAFA